MKLYVVVTVDIKHIVLPGELKVVIVVAVVAVVVRSSGCTQ